MNVLKQCIEIEFKQKKKQKLNKLNNLIKMNFKVKR